MAVNVDSYDTIAVVADIGVGRCPGGVGVSIIDFHEGLSWTPIKISNTSVRIIFGRELRKLIATTVVGNYSIVGPSIITVTSATIGVGTSNYVDLTVTGTFSTGTYSVTLAASTAQAQVDDSYNTTASQTFDVSTGAGAAGASRTLFNTGFN